MENLYLKPTTQLKPFQKEGVKFLLQHKQAILGDAVGLGKTLQILTTYSYYKSKFTKAKLLFLTNKTIVKQVQQEVYKFFDNLKADVIYENDKDERFKAYSDFINKDTDILVTSYSSLKLDLCDPTSVKLTLTNTYKLKEQQIKSAYGTLDVTKTKLTFTPNLKKLNATPRQNIQDAINFKLPDNTSGYIKFDQTKECYLTKYTLQDHTNQTQTKTYGELRHDLTNLSKQNEGLIIIFDEAIALKDPDSITHKACKILSNLATKVIAVTATVTKGQLEEAYYIGSCIGLSLVSTYKDFVTRFCIYKKSHFKVRGRQLNMLVGYKNIPEFTRLIQPHFIGRAKRDVAKELPAFTIKRYLVKEDELTHKAIKKIYTDALLTQTPPNIGRIRISTISPSLIDDTIPNDTLTAKVEEFIRIINDDFIDEKIVVYIDYKSPIDLLEQILPQHLPNKYKNILKITGDITDRAGVINKFTTSPDHNLLFINSAAKEGVNLQISGHLFFLTLPYKAGDYVQIAGRISRIGTTQTSLTIHNIIQESSADTDSEAIIQIGLHLMKQVSPSSVDQGLEQPHLISKDFDSDTNAETLLLKSFTSRAKRYIDKELTL